MDSSRTKDHLSPKGNRKRRKSSSNLSALQSKWKNFADTHQDAMKDNPFHDSYQGPGDMTKSGNDNWGVPVGKTLERGLKAHAHVEKEIQYLLDVISSMAKFDTEEGLFFVTFKAIFDRYVRISDKVVGILIRAKRRKLLKFESEMLWQGRDDAEKIYVLQNKLEKQEPKWLTPNGGNKKKKSAPINADEEERKQLAESVKKKPVQTEMVQRKKIDVKDTTVQKKKKVLEKELRSDIKDMKFLSFPGSSVL